MKGKTIIFFLLNLIINIDARLKPIVYTDIGPVQGRVLKTVIQSKEYSSFKGIPYAEAPLGYLRFKPPVPKEPWTEVLQATNEGPVCFQNDFVFHYYTGSEDCLYLNVYTPKLQFENITGNLIPVMVWIYGGAFKDGYGNSSVYGPDFLIEDNVVLVTFNYRLGALGFLNLNHENATGNAGLKDQNLVLHWVKRNIAKFGGDPNSVTIFGQSAGGVSVDFHILSDMSEGLFHRSISESGSPLCFWGYQTPLEGIINAFMLGFKLGKFTFSKEELLNTFYNASASEIIKAGNSIELAIIPFRPTTESTEVAKNQKKFLTECSLWKYISGNFYKVPYMTGFTAYEALYFSKFFEKYLEKLNHTSIAVKKFFKTSSIPLPIIDTIIPATAAGVVSLINFFYIEIINLATDFIFVAGIDQKRKFIQSHNSHPVYEYRYSFETFDSLHKLIQGINDRPEAAHGDELSNIFYVSVGGFPLDLDLRSSTARQRMVRLWTNFAKYSNPTPQNENDKLLQGIMWPDSHLQNSYLSFDDDLTIKDRPANIVTQLYEIANYFILPFQTGCISDLI